MKKRIEVSQKGHMYTHNNFHTSGSVHARTVAINVKRASKLDLISQATYIQSESFKNWTPLIWQGITKFQMLLGLGRRPTVVGLRPTKPLGGARMRMRSALIF